VVEDRTQPQERCEASAVQRRGRLEPLARGIELPEAQESAPLQAQSVRALRVARKHPVGARRCDVHPLERDRAVRERRRGHHQRLTKEAVVHPRPRVELPGHGRLDHQRLLPVQLRPRRVREARGLVVEVAQVLPVLPGDEAGPEFAVIMIAHSVQQLQGLLLAVQGQQRLAPL